MTLGQLFYILAGVCFFLTAILIGAHSTLSWPIFAIVGFGFWAWGFAFGGTRIG